ncbi:MAG: hypothetical protein QNJ20_10910 [Paracoccaceae bacterium]|nr:hypothetical protein [Paracoccaceae bacterium]
MTRFFRKNLRDEKGSVSVEAILMFPLLIWAYMGMYVFFEGLRESNINLKATYTVADVLSRFTDEEQEVTEEYLEGLHAVYNWMSRSINPVFMRVSVVTFNQEEGAPEGVGSHEKLWSYPINGVPELLDEEVATVITPHVPIMADQSSAIVVETWAFYEPAMRIGLKETTPIYNIVVTRPRFTDQLKGPGMAEVSGSTHDDQVSDDDNGL